MKNQDLLQVLFASLISLVSLAVLTSNALNIRNILGSAVMALAVALIAWIGKRKPIAWGIAIGALLFAGLFSWIDYMGWMSKG